MNKYIDHWDSKLQQRSKGKQKIAEILVRNFFNPPAPFPIHCPFWICVSSFVYKSFAGLYEASVTGVGFTLLGFFGIVEFMVPTWAADWLTLPNSMKISKQFFFRNPEAPYGPKEPPLQHRASRTEASSSLSDLKKKSWKQSSFDWFWGATSFRLFLSLL